MNGRHSRGPRALARVDVLVPCYAYGHLLAECVMSVCHQRDVDVRLIILDDASPDSTAEVADRLAARDSRIEVVHHEVNQGHIATFNDGLSRVEGDFVSLLSADDRLTDGALLRATDLMNRHPEVGFVYGRVRRFNRTWHEPKALALGATVWTGDAWLRTRCQRGVNVIASPEVTVRAATHRIVGGYEPSLPHTADLHLWLRLASVADVAYLRGQTQAGYRVHGASLQRTQFCDPIVDLEERWRMFRHLAHHAWSGRSDRDDLLGTAQRALHREARERLRRAQEHQLDDTVQRLTDLAQTIAEATSPPLIHHGDLGARRRLPSTVAGVRRRTRRYLSLARREMAGT